MTQYFRDILYIVLNLSEVAYYSVLTYFLPILTFSYFEASLPGERMSAYISQLLVVLYREVTMLEILPS